MKVYELVEKLKAFPAEIRVIAPGYEDDFDDVIDADHVLIKPDANGKQWCYERHEYLLKPETGAETAVRLKTNRRWEDETK